MEYLIWFTSTTKDGEEARRIGEHLVQASVWPLA